MKKKILIILVLAVLLTGVLHVIGASAAESGTCGNDMTWTLDDNGLLTISGTGMMTRHPWNREDVKKVVINNGVKTICDNAFSECKNLISVSFPDSLTKIGYQAFGECISLSSVTIPGNVTDAGRYSFEGCTGLTSIVICDGVEELYHTFNRCTNLVNVSIPSSVTNLGSEPFHYCSKLQSIDVSEENSQYLSLDGVLYSKDKSILYRYPMGKPGTQYSIPENVEVLADCVFDGCGNLSSVTIPDSVFHIGNYVFENCTGLTEITIPTGVKWMACGVFRGCSGLTNMTVPCSVEAYLFSGCSNLNSLTILSGAKKIGEKAFEGCNALKSLVIPGTLTKITDDAFWECPNLSSITVPINNQNAIQYFKDLGFEKALNIIPSQISDCEIDRIADVEFSGKAIEPEVHISDNGKDLVKGKDFTVSYENNINVGSATAIITGAGDYSGTVSKNFIIFAAGLDMCQFSTIKDQAYTGKGIKPDVSATLYETYKLKKNVDYTLSYKNNIKVGEATVVVTGSGNFEGHREISFRILPKTVKISSLKVKDGNLTLKWKKGKEINGYEINYSLKKDFLEYEAVAVRKSDKTQTVIKNLSKNKTYYFRIRTYKKTKNRWYYSEWSPVKSIKIK